MPTARVLERNFTAKRRFQTHGLEGLKDLPPIHHSHPFTTAPEVEERILGLSLEHPAWGCNWLSDWIKLEGNYVGAITIQKILSRNEMGSRYDRWLKLEQKNSQQAIELTAEQVRFLEKQSPIFRGRHVESSRPGELLCQDTPMVGTLKGVGRVYLQADLDDWVLRYNSEELGLIAITGCTGRYLRGHYTPQPNYLVAAGSCAMDNLFDRKLRLNLGI